MDGVLLEVGRDSGDGNGSREAVAWAGRLGDKAEPNARGAEPAANRRRQAPAPSPKVFPNEAARASGRLWRWDGKSRNSARSAGPWAASFAASSSSSMAAGPDPISGPRSCGAMYGPRCAMPCPMPRATGWNSCAPQGQGPGPSGCARCPSCPKGFSPSPGTHPETSAPGGPIPSGRIWGSPFPAMMTP